MKTERKGQCYWLDSFFLVCACMHAHVRLNLTFPWGSLSEDRTNSRNEGTGLSCERTVIPLLPVIPPAHFIGFNPTKSTAVNPRQVGWYLVFHLSPPPFSPSALHFTFYIKRLTEYWRNTLNCNLFTRCLHTVYACECVCMPDRVCVAFDGMSVCTLRSQDQQKDTTGSL